MDLEERVKTLEAEIQTAKAELRRILLDIRAYIMEAEAPFNPDFNMVGLSAQSDSEKGVEPNGNGQES